MEHSRSRGGHPVRPDAHAIYDIDSGGRVTPDGPIRIGDHVWLGKQAIVLKGADIGSGSVVGARGVVSGRIPPLSVCVGVPARVVRSNAIWTRRVGPGRLDQDEKAVRVVQRCRRPRAASAAPERDGPGDEFRVLDRSAIEKRVAPTRGARVTRCDGRQSARPMENR